MLLLAIRPTIGPIGYSGYSPDRRAYLVFMAICPTILENTKQILCIFFI